MTPSIISRCIVVAAKLARAASLVLCAGLATVLLMRVAPGYFSDTRELDTQYAATGRHAMEQDEAQQGSIAHHLRAQIAAWAHGDLGRSRQFDVPVSTLLRERFATTGKLVSASVLCGWAIALLLAMPLSARRTHRGEAFILLPCAVLLAVPVGAMATLCLVTDFGGPLLVLTALIAVRDFKLLYRLALRTWTAPHILHARALGLSRRRIVRSHLMPMLSRELLALMMVSLVMALSMAVPVEVIFDVPGLGQVAWSAALNRDLPALLAVTLLMAACVSVSALVADPGRMAREAECV